MSELLLAFAELDAADLASEGLSHDGSFLFVVNTASASISS